MSLSLNRREVDDLKSNLDRAIYKCLGYSDSSVLSTASNCLLSGYDRRKIADRLSSHIDSKKASRLAEKITQLAEDVVFNSKKRSHDSTADARDRDTKKPKTESRRHESSNGSGAKERDREKKADEKEYKSEKRADEKEYKSSKSISKESALDMVALLTNEGSVGSKMSGLSADRIKVMMANAQKEIEERKRALHSLKSDGDYEDTHNSVSAAQAAAAQIKAHMQHPFPPPQLVKPVTSNNFAEAEKQRKIAELQARIQSKLASGALSSSTSHPAPLILDREGRTVDRSGREVTLQQVVPTLKANLRAKRREEFRIQLGAPASGIYTPVASSSSAQQEEEGQAFMDPRVTQKPAARTKRALRFHEPGKFQQMAERIRMKAQLEKLQNEISQIAKKTGISSVTKLALMAPDHHDDEQVPELEWWDSVILMTAEEIPSKSSLDKDDITAWIKEDAITNLVEHPTQIRPPSDSSKPVYMPVFLTKKEMKKLRRQNRRETWKEEQEKVRLGLEAPAEPKLRISNLMRALGTEAVAEPSKIEAHVRDQMAKRQKAHLQHNAERKLTPEQKKEKLARRLKEDTSGSVHVAVYRVKDLFNSASNKFKVETNAKQLYMTGCVILHKDCCVVVVEGGPKQQAKYKRLMLQRIKWDDGAQTDPNNCCRLVWEGTVSHRSFGEIRFKALPTEKMAREHFRQHSVPHYWDLAFSSSLLDNEDPDA